MKEEGEYGEFATFARTDDRLTDAKSLLQAARGRPDAAEASLFCGCACMLLVIALEEETSLVVRSDVEARWGATVERPDIIGEQSPASLRGAKLPKRILALPRLMSGGRLRMRPSGVLVRALWELLGVRNLLAHKNPEIMLDLDAEATPPWDEVFLSALKSDPWRGVSVSAVERYLEAVSAYIDELQEVEEDDGGTYQGGAIIGLVGP